MGRNINDNACPFGKLSGRLNLFGVAASLLICATTQAANWVFAPKIFVGMDFTDNVELNPDASAESEAITDISPSFVLSRAGKQVNVNIDYRLRGLLYNGDDQRNEAYSYLSATSNVNVVPDLFTIAAQSSISQVVIDPRTNSPYSTISVSGNTTEIATLSVTPTLQHKLGPYTAVTLGGQFGLLEYDDPDQFDSKNNEIFANFSNEGGAGPLDWLLSFTSRSIDYDIGTTVEFVRTSGELAWRIGPRTELVASGGEDTNDFGSLPGTRAAEGSFWNVGLRGGIGATISYDLRVGEQFFGDSYSLNLVRDTGRMVTEITYTEEATTIGAEQIDYRNALAFITDVLGVDLPQSDPSLYIRKRGDFSQTMSFSNSSIAFRVFYEDRSYIRTFLAGQKENIMGSSVEWTWRYDDALNLSSNVSYLRLDSRDGFDQPEDLKLGATARRRLGEYSTIVLRYWLNMRSATIALREYEENTISIGYERSF